MIQFNDDHKDEFAGRAGLQAPADRPANLLRARRIAPPSKRALSDEVMTEKIHQIHTVNYGVYGVRKVNAELRRNGDQVARCTIERLMKREGLRGIRRAKGPRITVPGPWADRPSELVERRFTATAPDCLWVAD
ncbi:IS3 family transposase [Glaciihabitans sp. UYNi722]|uniref:IS3 family transposase n=1 Tax=Glaciihabitans sp. UYNi722 TaxID=3156344 RepID=UPI003395C4E6